MEQLAEVQIVSEDETAGKKRATARAVKPPSYDRHVNFLTVYLTITLCLSFWIFFDIWSGNLTTMKWIGVNGDALEDPLLRTIGFTIAGGAFGGILYHIRMLFKFYTSRKFDPRWIGKYISAPFESAAMAMVVLALIRGGVTLFGGSTGTDVNSVNNFAAFGVGALVGLGMRDVVRWVGRIVRSVFDEPPTVTVMKSENKRSVSPPGSNNGSGPKSNRSNLTQEVTTEIKAASVSGER